jgi:alpha-methylacyl-CoA racemase
MDRLGIGHEALRDQSAASSTCAITGYGQTGPYKERAGHDNNYLALSGMMSHSGRKTGGRRRWARKSPTWAAARWAR